jgi:hypothetical protein
MKLWSLVHVVAVRLVMAVVMELHRRLGIDVRLEGELH